ncbi:MAG TPA: rhodanese-like domain-containing protein [Candidatus Dormibacteraeota bacterium]|nr:rhodanese-like domain-containing protein [Candidatus Dormibacteraeota bacterium]
MTEQTAPFRDLKIDEVKKLIEAGDREVVDVREDWEWNKGHIPGARHVVLASILANPTAQEFRDGTIFVCQVGERSAVASEMAVALGVRDVVNFRGGTKAWKDAGLALEVP